MAKKVATEKIETTKAPKLEVESIDILEVDEGVVQYCIVGEDLVFNRKSAIVQQALLMPKKKTRLERENSLKHNPLEEFRASVHTLHSGPTLAAIPGAAMKGAMCSAALDLPDTNKAQIGRLVKVKGDMIEVYGVPKLFMTPVNMADMNHTPDIRTRARMPTWACRVTCSFVRPLIKANAVSRLMAAAGLFIGVGDGRNQKGKKSWGSFRIVEATNQDFLDIIKHGGRTAQEEALQTPECFDDESAQLYEWFNAELARREMKGVA
jgi:hypothetical protein